MADHTSLDWIGLDWFTHIGGQLATDQMQVERRTGKIRPPKTDIVPGVTCSLLTLCHASSHQPQPAPSKDALRT